MSAWGQSEREAFAKGIQKGQAEVDERALMSIAESLAKIAEMMAKDREQKA